MDPQQELVERLASAEREIDWLYTELRKRDELLEELYASISAGA